MKCEARLRDEVNIIFIATDGTRFINELSYRAYQERLNTTTEWIEV